MSQPIPIPDPLIIPPLIMPGLVMLPYIKPPLFIMPLFIEGESMPIGRIEERPVRDLIGEYML
jgi:hypothetical protein